MTDTEAETDGEMQSIDETVFEQVDPLIDNWLNGRGDRLYRLADGIGDYPPIHALTSYERTIDKDTGETVETETIEGLGRLIPFVNIGSDARRVQERLIDDNPELWDELAVEHLLEAFEHYIDDRLLELIETAPERNFVDIYLHQDVRIAIDEDLEARKLSEGDRSFNDVEWGAFLWAMREETTLIDSLIGEDVAVESEQAYAFRPEFEPVPEWRLRAVELNHCGVFKNAPALANLRALQESDEQLTQADIANELGKTQSTVSEQVVDVEDWLARAEWMCENHLDS